MSALPALPAASGRIEFEAVGFVGWRSWSALRSGAFAVLPNAPGSYVIYRDSSAPPALVEPGSGGHFKGRNPNVAVTTLTEKWVPNARTVYIGKATVLRSRLRAYANFGNSRPVGHWGGRYIWQLLDAQDLQVAWRALATPELARQDEVALLARFQAQHGGQRPFANLTG